MKHVWLYPSKTDIETERRQCEEEGRDLSSVMDEFDRVMSLDLEDRKNWPAAESLLDQTIRLPIRDDYQFEEPSDLEGIRAARHRTDLPELPPLALTDAQLEDKVYGAWAGRCAGCLLGKPVEGVPTGDMWPALQALGRWPLSDYFRSSDATLEIRRKYPRIYDSGQNADRVAYMPEDDDTNYTTTGLAILKRFGPDFTPADVAHFWLSDIPILHTCTAERVAYRNLCLLIPPPESASFRNPYREWIGAQIRADFWGYANPGDPERAAEFAWRDASISHVKNGIYGEMWAAAMIAAAFVTDDPGIIIRAGLAEIPRNCRLAKAIHEVLGWHREGIEYDAAVRKLHETWNQHRAHDWCHTISNAIIVAIGLLWGEGDFGQSVCRAVQPCFDTDCNGATVGSIAGVLSGRKAIPARWIDLINDTLHTGVTGYHAVRLSEITKDSLALIEKVRG
ncbi:MAG: ADP-ribosylglycohydrolase family protein [Armatimonadetes bacterium]|nr:ADP-ribosylglycohydrolase family protein [Armatimonadota bacterium]